jgi:ElaB/YqjD/DUF883 family membrane-anchored ribosome-binding protein
MARGLLFSRSSEDTMDLTKDLEDTAREVRRHIRPQVREAERRLDALNDDVTDYIKENPAKCLLGALAVGIIIGKLASR